MSELANEWFGKGEISKNWRNWRCSAWKKLHTLQNSQRRKLSTITYYRLQHCNRKSIKIYRECMCAFNWKYAFKYRIRDTSHLLDIIDTINEKGIPDKIILLSFDIVNMFPRIDNVKGMDAVRLALNTRGSNKPSTECVLEVYYKHLSLVYYLILRSLNQENTAYFHCKF